MSAPDLCGEDRQYITTAQVIKKVLDLLGQGQEDVAARLYSHCAEDIGFLLMTKAPRDRKLQARLAKMFFKSKDYEKAALVLEANNEFQRAAELYERTDQYEQAAEMWARVGDKDRAAHNFEKFQDWQKAAGLYIETENYERAAYCFEKAVNNFLAGKYYFQIQKFQKSMELLQKVARDDNNYLDAAVLIGNILAMNGYLDMAVAKYRSVTQSVKLGSGTLSIYFNLAQLLERRGDIQESLDIYKSIAGIDDGYREVQKRISKLEGDIARGVEVEPVGEGCDEMPVLDELEEVEEEVMATAGPHPDAVPRAQIVSVMEGFEFLKNTSLFEELSLTEMKRMYTICETRDFEDGNIMIEQDQPGQALFIIKKGKVKVQRVAGDKVTDLVELGPGNHVGEMALVDQAPTSARVAASPEGAQAFVVTREKFEDLLNSDDKIAIKIYRVFIETMCDRLRSTTAELSAIKAEKSA